MLSKNVSITEHVISSIAGTSAMEVEGVSGLRGNVAENLMSFLGDDSRRRGVIAKEEDGAVKITLHVAIEFGFPIHEVAQKIQENVKKEVEMMTGLFVHSVDVYVSDLTIIEENDKLEPEEALEKPKASKSHSTKSKKSA